MVVKKVVRKKSHEQKKNEEALRDKFSLGQHEIHDYGLFVLKRVSAAYQALIHEPDCCWGIESDLDLLNRLAIMTVRLQCGKRLKEEKNGINK